MNKEFNSCKIEIDNDGHYKCSILYKSVWISSYGLTEIQAFDKLYDIMLDIYTV